MHSRTVMASAPSVADIAAVSFEETESPLKDCKYFFKKASYFIKQGKKNATKVHVRVGEGIIGVDGKKYVVIAIEQVDKEVTLWCCGVGSLKFI